MIDPKEILVDGFGHGLALIAADGAVRFLNSACRQLLGIAGSAGPLTVQDLGIVHPREFWRADLRHAEMLARRDHQEIRLLATTFVRPEGTILLLETGVSQIEDDFRFFVMDNMGEGVVMLDRDGCALYMNNAATIILGVGLHAGQARRWTIDNIGEFLPKDFWRTAATKKEVTFRKSGVTRRLLASTYHRGGMILVCLQDERDVVERYLSPRSTAPRDLNGLLGISPELRREAMMLANSDLSFLITGETGTGKEVMARAVHFSSQRMTGPFIVIDCTALPKDLMESELFGYEDGSFTGARRDGRPGKFEQANGGTVLLDEIADLPLALQPKLLRVLNDKVVTRIGAQKSMRADVRVIACSNRDLKRLSDAGQFRPDLYFRLKGAELRLPPLRERMQYFDELFALFLGTYGHGRQYPLSPQAKTMLHDHHWPGNIRELEKTVQYILSREPAGEISPEQLPPDMKPGRAVASDMTLKRSMRMYERAVIGEALHENKYDVKATAARLGLSQWGLRRKVRELGIRCISTRELQWRHRPRIPKWIGQGNRASLEIVSAAPSEVAPGGAVAIHLRVTNLGINSWTDIATSSKPTGGEYSAYAAWLKQGDAASVFLPSTMAGHAVLWGGVKKVHFPALPGIVNPGQSVDVRAVLRAPREAMNYALIFTMAQSGVGNFLQEACPNHAYVIDKGSFVVIQVKQKP